MSTELTTEWQLPMRGVEGIVDDRRQAVAKLGAHNAGCVQGWLSVQG